MTQCTAHTKLNKSAVLTSLIECFKLVPDHRSDQGKRFELAFLLSIVFLGFLKGKTSIEACVGFAQARKRWLTRWFDLTHGIPADTTIGRALAVTFPSDLIRAVNQFLASYEGVTIEAALSLDGKTVKAISEIKEGFRHFLSLFSHTTCRILDQEGVTGKENEITATPRMMVRNVLVGSIVTADALLTQTRVTQSIRQAGGDYLLIVKDNHRDLKDILAPTFTDPLTKTVVDIFYEMRKDRQVETVVTLTQDLDLAALQQDGWCDLAVVGKLERRGKRLSKRTQTIINETIYFISSRAELTPQAAATFIRQHWHIENKLHWQKDVTWREDRQRTKTGEAAGILSYLRSLALSCIKQKYTSVTQAIETFTEKPKAYLALLTQLHLV